MLPSLWRRCARLAVFVPSLLLGIIACSPASAPGGLTFEPEAPDSSAYGAAQPTSSGALGSTRDPKPTWDHSASPIPVTPRDPSIGNPDAIVTIVEFTDFQCPFCKEALPTLEAILKEYSRDQVRLIFKHHPLPFHERSAPAHRAASTVYFLKGNLAFWRFHNLVFEHVDDLTEANFADWAVAVGIDRKQFVDSYTSGVHASKVDDDTALAAALGANGTPSFYINGILLRGAQPVEKFKKHIDDQLVKGRDLLAQNTARDVLYVALSKTQARLAPTQPGQRSKIDATTWHVPILQDDPAIGASSPLVTIVEWSDFQCPYCRRIQPTLKRLLREYPNDLRLVWKDNPLEFHGNAIPAAILTRLAFERHGHSGFWKAHDLVFAQQSQLEHAARKDLAQRLRLDWLELQAAILDHRFIDKIEANMGDALDLNAPGTPHFFINGRRLPGAQPYEKFKELIEAQLAAARALVAQGTPRSDVYSTLMRRAQRPDPPRRVTLAIPADAPSRGPKNARVVIQIWGDFQCPFCRNIQPTLDRLDRAFDEEIRWVWRHLPLSIHEDAELAAEASLEAFHQDDNPGFWQFHDHIFQAPHDPNALKPDALEQTALKLGFDRAGFSNALKQHIHQARVRADVRTAIQAEIYGTPTFLINGYLVSGAQPYATLKKIVKKALDQVVSHASPAPLTLP